MDIHKSIKRIMSLRRLASNQAGTPEGETALKQAKVLEGRCGLEVPDDAAETVSRDVKTGHIWEELLLEVLSETLGVSYGYEGGRVSLGGSQLAVGEVIDVFKLHRDQLERIAITSAMAYMGTAIPEFGDTLLHIINKSKGAQGAREAAGVVEDPATEGDDDRYAKAEIMSRVFDPDSASASSDGRIIDLMRSIGLRNVRPFWEKYKR